MEADSTRIILASGSPRRQQLLRDLGLNFEIITADIDETPRPNEDPLVLVQRLAESKAETVAKQQVQRGQPCLIIAADTMVAHDGALLGKPIDRDHARELLLQLRSQIHQVHSALSMVRLERDGAFSQQQTKINSSDIFMREYSDAEIDAYIASGDPMDKAGAYAIQHPTFAPAQRLSGCISGVMGLALIDLTTMLAEFGIETNADTDTVSICEGYASFACCQNEGKT